LEKLLSRYKKLLVSPSENYDMKKTLIALAAFAAVSAFAQSSVTMYGTVDVGFGGASKDGVETKFQQQSAYNSTSKIGFKGTEDLGGGLKANFGLETGGITMEDGAAAGLNFTRASWVGVEGAFGDVKMGRIASKAAAAMGQFDFNGTSTSSASNTAGLSAVTWYGSSRRSSQVQYTKAVGDVTIHFANTMTEDNYTAGTPAVVGGAAAVPGVAQNNRTTFGLTYAKGPWAAAVVTESASASSNRAAYAVGASYDMKSVKVAATYNQRETEVAGQGMTVSAIVPMGAANFGVQFANNTGSTVAATTVKSATELFANYALSKRTTVYIDSVFGGDTTGGANKSYNMGVIHNF
jgi:predicted porin